MTFSSPLFQQLNGLKTNEDKIARAFPLQAPAEGGPQGVGLFARFAFAGAVCVRSLCDAWATLMRTDADLSQSLLS